MSNEFDSIIHRRSIKLDVIVPERFIWEFLESYGRAFAIRDSHQGLVFKQVDGYDYHPNGWHVTVTVADFHENKFYDFVRQFMEIHELTFRDPRDK